MGIRVFCPNGHRLNLKSHLAGKQGICPHCGMTVNIPSLERAEELGMLKNPRLSGREGLAAAGELGGANGYRGGAAILTIESAEPTARTNGSTSNGSAGLHQEDRTASRIDDGGVEIPLRSDQRTPSSAAAVAAVAVSASVAEPAPVTAPVEDEIDPIAENPQAVWYVRTPQGGQYGPAAGDIMRKWIAEGRVQADFWVWREGWGDWQKASASIPSLRGSTLSVAPATAAVPAASAGTSSAASAVATPVRQATVAAPSKPGEPNGYATAEGAAAPRGARSRRRGIHPLAILAVVGLGLVCLALFGVLVAMLAGAI